MHKMRRTMRADGSGTHKKRISSEGLEGAIIHGSHLIMEFSPAGARNTKHSSSPLSTTVDRAPSATPWNRRTANDAKKAKNFIECA